jgi:hypothetical protein
MKLTLPLILFLAFNGLAQFNPISLGRASNMETIMTTKTNQVYANDSLGIVVFLHQQDVTIWGGGGTSNGMLRYDLSTDKGASFTNDIGVLNPIYTNYARYPQITGFNATGNTNPLTSKFVWTAATNHFPTPGYTGYVTGFSNVALSSPASTESYYQNDQWIAVPGGLCQGLSGEYWMVDFESQSGTPLLDSLFIFKGTYNSMTQDVDWSRYTKILLNYATTYDGTKRAEGPNMSFSPDGSHGWVGFLGDLAGGSDSTYNPIFVHSSDGGQTWGAPIEVDLRNINFLSDNPTIQDALLEGLYNPNIADPPSGRPTCTTDYDITVDANGNPHLFVVVANASTIGVPEPNYEPKDDYGKLALDIFSTDGGITWNAVKIAPIYTYASSYGTIGFDPIFELEGANNCQISRTTDGSHLFYSWVDSDTTEIGFGEASNLAPNLRIAGLRVNDMMQTCPKWISKGDPIYDGKLIFPTMAPEVITSNNGDTYHLPIVFPDMLTNNPNEPCQFLYAGNSAYLTEGEFGQHISTIDTDDCYFSPSGITENSKELIRIYPNPSNGKFILDLQENTSATTFRIYDTFGRVVHIQEVIASETMIDLSSLSEGSYYVVATSESNIQRIPILIVK